MTDDQVAAVITAINDAGWTVASVGQTDDKHWIVELREGYKTSYGNVLLTDPMPTMLAALNKAERKAAVLELRAKAHELVLSGKLSL